MSQPVNRRCANWLRESILLGALAVGTMTLFSAARVCAQENDDAPVSELEANDVTLDESEGQGGLDDDLNNVPPNPDVPSGGPTDGVGLNPNDLQNVEAATARIRDNLQEAANYLREIQWATIPGNVPGASPANGFGPVPVSIARASLARATTSTTEVENIHVFLFGDTSDGNIGEGAKANLAFMEALLNHQGGTKCTIHAVVRGANFRLQTIQSTLSNDVAGPNDTVFCYFACHGATDVPGAPYFQLPNGANLARADVRKWLSDMGARQTVLISDSCSVTVNARVDRITTAMAVAGRVPTHALRNLLHFGLETVDINGSSPPPANNGQGEFGWYIQSAQTDGGGIFTRAFWNASLYATPANSWDALLDEARSLTQAEFKSKVLPSGKAGTQTRQTPFRRP